MLCCTRLCARLTATTIKHSKCPMSTATNTIERPLSLEERLQLLETMPDQLKGKIIEEPDWTNIDVMLAEDVEHVRNSEYILLLYFRGNISLFTL